MIACVDEQRDFSLYLAHEEVFEIKKGVVEGVLIRIHKPYEQGLIFICFDESRKNNNGFGIGVEDNWPWSQSEGYVKLFIGNSFYNYLLSDGQTGTRYGQMGSKIHLYDLSCCGFSEQIAEEHLRFYKENKDNLKKRFQEKGF